MWWNIFSSKACQLLRALGTVMVLIVLGVIGLTYYTTVVVVYGPLAGQDNSDGKFAKGVLVVYHALILMVLWSYFACVLTEPGRVPDSWQPPPEDEEEEAAETCKSNSEKRRRFCRKCTQWKPERCHHCSVCGRCVLKMDHHCVWIANCVGAYNYKFFLLFLLYTFLATVFDAIVLLSNFVDFFKDLEARREAGSPSPLGPDTPEAQQQQQEHRTGEEQTRGTGMAVVFVTFVLDVAFAASLLGFIIMHANLNLSNMTTIEMYEKKKTLPWRFDRGHHKNLLEVFGENPVFWLVPVHTPGQLFRLLHISRLSGGRYPEMERDGLDPAGRPTEAGEEELMESQRSRCC
uniref:S-acyltransferase n=1 Tax=Mantoniella antarctica TaxID=81844 RepID=A0A7S0T2N3_9CHLO|mmetsp:Transcript_6832/g.16969  ORF Transcript_6832/g.16969 Transcript_6832/m.16969 type:complete len:347 (+) Transcript_6832:275-1315(+)